MSLLDDVSIVVTPNGYKAGELYAVVPVPTEGAEEVTNGNFATDSDWTFGGTSFSAGAILFDDANDNAFQSWTDTVNTLYKLTITKTGSGTLRFRSGFAGSAATKIEIPESGIIYFTSTSDTNRIQIYGDENSINATLNSVSLKQYTSADMDVTRATAATRVDEDGLVNYAEIIGSELVTNGDFELNSDWNNFSTPTTSEQSTEQSHTGTYSWKVIADATQEGIFSPNNFSITNGNSYSVSLWIYSVSGNSIKSGLNNTNVSVFTERTVIAGQWTNITYEATATSTGASYISILSQNSLNYYVDDVSVKELTRDNVPRIDYTGGGCPHILSEPQRTNTVTYSEDFSQYNQSGTTPTLTTGQLAPDGTLGATKISGTIGSSVMWLPDDSSTTATRSIYARTVSGTGTATLMSYFLNTNNLFTLTEEWQRFELTGTTTGSGGTHFYIDFRDSSQTLSEFIVWGGQSEEATYATSYIPTSGSTVTRNQDQFTRDGIGSLINDSEGVLFAEIAALANDASYRYMGLTDGSSDNRVVILYYNSNNRIRVLLSSGGTKYFDEFYAVTSVEDFHKVAVKWKVNDFALWIDGVERATDTSGSAPIGLNTLALDQADANFFFGKVKQLQVYTTALTDEQLLQLTGTSGTDFYESYAEMASALTYTIQ
jgi:hypothetical protein